MFFFPMLGRSSRFFDSGYTLNKYKLPLGSQGNLVFDFVVSSFSRYFLSDRFVFLCRADANDKQFLTDRLNSLGVKSFIVLEHSGETRGQADSVLTGLNYLDFDENDELFIFNIDTILFNFQKNPGRNQIAGYLEVFHAAGNHWSFVEPDSRHTNRARRVVEKQRISDLCSNGLYYFSSVKVFQSAICAFLFDNPDPKQEFFVAPLYNWLIARGLVVEFSIVPSEDVGLCGVPSEYEALKTVFRSERFCDKAERLLNCYKE